MAVKRGEEMTKKSIESIFNEMTDILVKKNQDYKGASFDLGLMGNMVHLWDKVSRYRSLVENMLKGGPKPNFEGIRDTLLDQIGYSVIGLHILDQMEAEKDSKGDIYQQRSPKPYYEDEKEDYHDEEGGCDQEEVDWDMEKRMK